MQRPPGAAQRSLTSTGSPHGRQPLGSVPTSRCCTTNRPTPGFLTCSSRREPEPPHATGIRSCARPAPKAPVLRSAATADLRQRASRSTYSGPAPTPIPARRPASRASHPSGPTSAAPGSPASPSESTTHAAQPLTCGPSSQTTTRSWGRESPVRGTPLAETGLHGRRPEPSPPRPQEAQPAGPPARHGSPSRGGVRGRRRTWPEHGSRTYEAGALACITCAAQPDSPTRPAFRPARPAAPAATAGHHPARDPRQTPGRGQRQGCR